VCSVRVEDNRWGVRTQKGFNSAPFHARSGIRFGSGTSRWGVESGLVSSLVLCLALACNGVGSVVL
jgi:hypothetical protein